VIFGPHGVSRLKGRFNLKRFAEANLAAWPLLDETIRKSCGSELGVSRIDPCDSSRHKEEKEP